MNRIVNRLGGLKQVGEIMRITRLLQLALAAVVAGSSAHAQLYVSMYGNNTVGEYNATTGAAINASFITGLSGPVGLALFGNALFVANYGNNTVGEYNAATGAAINANFITGLSNPTGLALSGSDLFVANQTSNIVGKYDAITGAAINASFITGLSHPYNLAVSGYTLFVVNGDSGPNLDTIGTYNATTGAPINATLLTLFDPTGIAVSGNKLFVSNAAAGAAGDGTIGEYDAITGAVINANFITGLNGPEGLAVSDNKLFVANWGEPVTVGGGTVGEYTTTGAAVNANFITGLTIPTDFAVAAQTFTTLYSFCSQSRCTDGDSPVAALVQSTNGDLYGTTIWGGTNPGPNGGGAGTVFKMTPSGTLSTLYSFCSQANCTDGAFPGDALIQAINGDLYGTTEGGGADPGPYTGGAGTVFKITPSGTLTTVYSFCSKGGCADGATPVAGLLRSTDGDFYGTTYTGGANGDGTVFKITPSGTLTTLYSFCSQSECADGANPYAGLIQGTNGDFYGTTEWGGAFGFGTVFGITPSGRLTNVYSFNENDGANPTGALVQATDGNFYGTTQNGGGPNNDCSLQGGCGTVFKITPSGRLTTLYSFCSQGSECPDGSYPYAGLAQGSDGNFYGTTYLGGTGTSPNCKYQYVHAVEFGCGTVFKITPSATFTTLHSFDRTDGSQPIGGLAQDTNGEFYGTTNLNSINAGTVFGLSVGLRPFVKTQTTSGVVGGAVRILGSDLTDATSVTFNGTLQPTFTVVSRYLIKTTVPDGATTGTVQVVTPGRTLSSNVPFRVLP